MRIGRLKLKLQLICGESYAIGPGKADLLEAIDREGSIAGAGRALGMSYRRTWLLVDEMNRCFRTRVVETIAGGSKQRGARVSAFGREMLTAYRAMEAEAGRIAASEAYRILEAGMLDQPRAPSPCHPAAPPA